MQYILKFSLLFSDKDWNMGKTYNSIVSPPKNDAFSLKI